MDHSFGTWVKRRRKTLDLTQQELAERVGCSVSLILKIESDDRRPSRQIAALLAEHLEIPGDQRELFQKIARQEKGVQNLDALPRLSTPQPVPASRPLRAELPAPLTPLIGRGHELMQVMGQMQDPVCRLLTLTGPGGVGKTHLALEAAHKLRDSFEHGALFVSLAGTVSPEFIVPAIADSLGHDFSRTGALKAQLLGFLKERELLLVLDNLEHLLSGIELLDELLEHAPRLKLLTTSREPLGLRSAWTFEVQGLPVPSTPELESLESNSAATLFLQRARQARLDFTPDAEDARAIVRICQLVEGLPLGLELAAPWVRTLSCREIASEIETNLDFLTSSARDVPDRHRSMRAVLDYSWALLSTREQEAMMNLAVFRGGFTREAAAQVAGAALQDLSALADRSLIRYGGDGRYAIHELIRQYAREQLVSSGGLEATLGRHLLFFLGLAEEASVHLRGPAQLVWLRRLEADYDNLRSALEWSLRREGSAADEKVLQMSLQLSNALYPFWKLRANWNEGRRWLERVLARSADLAAGRDRILAVNTAGLLAVDQSDGRAAVRLAEEALALAGGLGDPYVRASVLNTLGLAFWRLKDFVGARQYCEEALAGFREQNAAPLDIADTLRALGHIATNQHDLEAARRYLEECLEVFRKLEDRIEATAALGDLGLLAYLRDDYSTARRYYDEGLLLFREAGDIGGIELALNRLGDVARCEGDYEEAGRLYAESLAVYQDTGDKDEIASILHNLGYVAQQQRDLGRAADLFREGLALQVEMENQAGIAECLTGIASVLVLQGRAADGARLFGAAEVLREKSQAVLWPANRIEYDGSMAALRREMDEASITAAWAAGRALSTEQAVAEAAA